MIRKGIYLVFLAFSLCSCSLLYNRDKNATERKETRKIEVGREHVSLNLVDSFTFEIFTTDTVFPLNGAELAKGAKVVKHSRQIIKGRKVVKGEKTQNDSVKTAIKERTERAEKVKSTKEVKGNRETYMYIIVVLVLLCALVVLIKRKSPQR